MTAPARPRRGLAAALGAAMLVAAALLAWGVPYPTRTARWSIGLYQGPSPLALGPAPGVENPVLSAADVTDRRTDFVADPFMVERDGNWFMFFEALDHRSGRGAIALATSGDARTWRYQRVVLEEPFHLSYPYVFASEGSYYLIPESAQAQAVRLYRADDFPTGWRFVSTLLAGEAYADPTIIEHDGRWWLFAATDPATNARLDLYSAEHLEGPWRAHPMNPIVRGDPHGARPAGRIVAIDDRLFRFAQDDAPRYGLQVFAFEITALSDRDYAERPVGAPVLGPGGADWNRRGMHHIDPHRLGAGDWLAAVDGSQPAWTWRFWSW